MEQDRITAPTANDEKQSISGKRPRKRKNRFRGRKERLREQNKTLKERLKETEERQHRAAKEIAVFKRYVYKIHRFTHLLET